MKIPHFTMDHDSTKRLAFDPHPWLEEYEVTAFSLNLSNCMHLGTPPPWSVCKLWSKIAKNQVAQLLSYALTHCIS